MADTNTPSQSQSDESQSKPQATTSSSSFDSQVAFLQELISSPTTEEESSGNLGSLLQQLDVADNVAKGVESQLDRLLENLEGILQGFESNDGRTVAGEGGSQKGESASAKPPDQSMNTKDSG